MQQIRWVNTTDTATSNANLWFIPESQSHPVSAKPTHGHEGKVHRCYNRRFYMSRLTAHFQSMHVQNNYTLWLWSTGCNSIWRRPSPFNPAHFFSRSLSLGALERSHTSPLHRAIYYERSAILCLLLSNNANIYATTVVSVHNHSHLPSYLKLFLALYADFATFVHPACLVRLLCSSAIIRK